MYFYIDEMKNLKKYRTERGVSQEALAKKVGIHPVHLSRYERNLSVPSIEVARKIADILEVSIDELVNGKLDMKAEQSIKDKDMLNLFKKVQELSNKKKETIKELINSFIITSDLEQKLIS